MERLLIVIHHLVIDAISWRILLEDLQTAHEQLTHGTSINYQPKQRRFKIGPKSYEDHAQSAYRHCNNFPTGISKQTLSSRDHPRCRLIITAVRIRCRKSYPCGDLLSLKRQTHRLNEVPAAYHTQMNDVLLTALALALSQWTGQRAHVIDLEGHGPRGHSLRKSISRAPSAGLPRSSRSSRSERTCTTRHCAQNDQRALARNSPAWYWLWTLTLSELTCMH